MGEVISPKADIARVEQHIRTAYERAIARGGEIAAAAEARIGPAVAAINAAVAVRDPANKAESASWALVLAEDAKSDPGIGSVRDAMWNALGRPKQSTHLDEVFPGGISTYTAGDPRGQPLLMQVLQSRILSASAPQWSDEKRKGWATEIEVLRVPYHAAVEAYRPAEAAALIAETGYRAAVRSGHARLRTFKRDLKSLGLTEAQIHEIIPDAGSGRSSGSGEDEDEPGRHK
jgi:hypothetical protein